MSTTFSERFKELKPFSTYARIELVESSFLANSRFASVLKKQKTSTLVESIGMK